MGLDNHVGHVESSVGNLDRRVFLEGSSLKLLRGFLETQNNDFFMGFVSNQDTVKKYWSQEFVNQMKAINPEKFGNLDKSEVIQASRLSNFIDKGRVNWSGLDEAVRAMEKTREVVLRQENKSQNS